VREDCHATDTASLPLPSAQRSYGIPVEVAGDETGIFAYTDDFSGQKLIDDATIDGFLDTRWDAFEERLGIVAGETATLTWQLWSTFEMREPSVNVASEGGVETSLQWSADGNTWSDAELGETLGELGGRNLWVRLTATAGDKTGWLDDLSISGGNVLPEERVVRIAAKNKRGAFEWVDDFEAPRSLHLAQIEGGEELEWVRGHVQIRGHEGQQVRPTLRWHFIFERPLEDATVTIESYSHRSLSAHNEFVVSLDGETPLLTETTSGREDESGRYVGTIEFDLADDERFEGVTELWVEATLVNGAAVPTNRSNDLRELRISGQMAPAE